MAEGIIKVNLFPTKSPLGPYDFHTIHKFHSAILFTFLSSETVKIKDFTFPIKKLLWLLLLTMLPLRLSLMERFFRILLYDNDSDLQHLFFP